MFAAIFVLIIISLLAIQFHYMTRQAQSTAFRFQASEIARQLAESAVDEAFLYIYKQSENSSGTFFKKIVDRSGTFNCSTTSLDNLSSKGAEVPIELTRAHAAAILNGNKFDIETKARIIDFRNADSTGGKYYGQEGIGTLEIKVVVKAKDAFKKQIQGGCVISRHHDYKVVSIVSKRDNSSQRSGYAQNYVLDYALFIRNGQEEFDAKLGTNLNPEKQKFTIDQTGLTSDNCGKIYLGNRPGKFVYLNLDPARKDFIPSPVEKKKIIKVNGEDTFKLLPQLEQMMRARANQKVRAEGARLENFKLSNHNAYFEYARYPITNDALSSMDKMTENRDTTLAGEAKSTNTKAVLDFPPGVIFKPESLLGSILEGDIRQRYFHFGYFYLDLTGAQIYVRASKKVGFKRKYKSDTKTITDTTIINKYKNTRFPCFDPDQFEGATGLNDFIDLRYMKDNFANTKPELLCDIKDTNRYLKGANTILPTPVFYNYRSLSSTNDPLSGTVPFAHVNLWTRRKLSLAQAEEFGIFIPGQNKLKLRGVVQINEPVILGENGNAVEIEGQGVLIAPGITIKAGIKKKDGDSLCVLLTRGYPIVVDTTDLIEASLVSIGKSNNNGFVKALKQLNLKGALAVDLLRLDQWAEGVEHTVKYDPALKSNKDIYQVNISRWVSFERMIEKDE